MSDLISREAVLKRAETSTFTDKNEKRKFMDWLNYCLEAPIEPQWIPCSERLPESEDKYLWVNCNVTVMRNHWPTSSYDFCDSPYDEYFVTGAMYDSSQKIWHLSDNMQLNALIDIEDSPLNGDCVIAWMPLPEAYKGE